MALSEAEELELLELEEQEHLSTQKQMAAPSLLSEEAPEGDFVAEDAGPSGLESLGRGLSQGSTLGFQDELSPMLERGFAKLFGDKDTKALYASKSNEDLRNTYRDQNKAAQEANPGLYTTGQVTGSTPLMLATGGGSGLGAAAATNAAFSGLNTLGESESSNISDLAKEGLTSAAIGGTLGAGFNLAGKGLSKAGKYLAPKAKKAAEEFAVASVGRKNSVLKDLLYKDQVDDLGRELLDSGVVGLKDSSDDILGKVDALKRTRGKQLGRIVEEADELIKAEDAVLSTGALKKDLKDNFIRQLKGEIGRADDANAVEDYLNRNFFDVMKKNKQNEVSLSTLRELRGKIDDQITKFGGPTPDVGRQETLRELRGFLEKRAEGQFGKLDDQVGLPLKDLYTGAKQKFGLAANAKQLADDTRLRSQRNNMFGLTETIIGAGSGAGAAYASQDPTSTIATGLGTMALVKGVRGRGYQVSAVVLDKLSKKLASDPSKLGKYAGPLMNASRKGAQNLAVTNYVLQQTDPEYRQTLDGLSEE